MPIYVLHALFRVNNYLIVEILRYSLVANVFLPHACVRRYIFRGAEKVGLQELGPRLTLKLRSLQEGTFDSKHGEYIWVHKVSVYNRLRAMCFQGFPVYL